MTRLRLLAAVAAAAGLLATAAPARAGFAAATVTGGGQAFGDGPFTLGYRFQANSSFLVDALGAYDVGANGLGAPLSVGLWTDAGTLIASTTVTNANPLAGGFRYNAITPVALTAGQVYRVASTDTGEGYLFDPTVTFAPNITFLNSVFNGGTPLAFPGSIDPRPGVTYFGGSFTIQGQDVSPVPAPPAAALALMGLASAGGLARLRRRAA